VRGKGFGGTGGALCVGLHGPEGNHGTRGARDSFSLPVGFPFFLLYCSVCSLRSFLFLKITCQRTGRGTIEGEPRHTLVTSRGARGKFGVGGKLQREGWAWVFCLSFFIAFPSYV
jgi:hypothetical protein